jgi:hypothetical protein
MKIGSEERKLEAINQKTFTEKKLLDVDFIQQDHKSEYIFPILIDLFKRIDPDLFYNSYEKTNITHVNTFAQFAEFEFYQNELFECLDLNSDFETDNQISVNILCGDIQNLSKN